MKKAGKFFLTLFLFSLSFIPFLWLSKGQLVLGYDAVFPLNPLAFLTDRLYSWTTTQGFSMDQSGIQGSLIIHIIDSIPYFLGFSSTNAEKITFGFWFFAMIFSSYIFIVRLEKSGLIKSKYLRYFFPVFYTFNFYLLQGWWAIERTKFSLVVAAPLILSIVIPMIKEKLTVWKVLKYSIVCSLILTIFNGGGWVGFPLYGGLLVLLGCYYIFFTFLFFLQKKTREWAMMSLFFLFFLFWYLFLNAYTLLPFILTTVKSYGEIVQSAGGITGLIDWSRYIGASASFINLFRLQGIPDWYNNGRFHPYSSVYLNDPIFIFISFLIPIFIFVFFIKKRNDYKIIIPFFLLTMLVSEFLTAGAHPPLGFIFEFLMRFVPGFVAFRSAIFKFGYAYWFSVSFFVSLLISNFLIFVIDKIKNSKVANSVGIIAPIVIIVLILLYHFPFLTGNIFKIDPTSISARVNMPSYIPEFTKWWQENGQENKILLLPKLNDNWFFEQYKWNYISLFPVTANFASQGIVENAVILSEKEQGIVNDLYDAINTEKFEKVDYLTSILGIQYFLIRHDFYYDYPNQKTDNPIVVEQKLIANPKISLANNFGEWTVYKYSDPKPPITVHSNAVLTSGNVTNDEIYPLNKNDQLTLNQDVFNKFPEIFSSIIVSPACLNCSIEREEIQVNIPRPRILLDSNLYQLVELRDKLKIKKNETIEEKTNRLIGNTLRLTGQIDQLIDQDRDVYFIGAAKDKLTGIISEISGMVSDIFNKSDNSYRNAALIQQYLGQESSHFNDLINSTVDKKEILTILEEVLHSIQGLQDKLKSYYNDSDYSQKIYRFVLVKEGNYTIKINKDSFGVLESPDFKDIYLSIDQEVSRNGELDGPDINFGTVFLKSGSHNIKLIVPPQKSIISTIEPERVAGKSCYSSFIDDFSYKKVYSLRFQSKNNFDPSFFFFIDHGNNFSPILVNYIAFAGEQVKNERIIVSAQRMQLDKTTNRLRVSFCALSLTEDRYKENIKNLSMTEITSPQLFLSYNLNNKEGLIPEISFKEVNQTHFKVHIKDASSPYFLALNQKYAPGWTINSGKHEIGNAFQNTWYINKLGNYDIDIFYKPQEDFNIGLIISIIALFTGSSIIIWRLKKNV